MELIPIIKYVLSAVSLLSMVVVGISYILYKIKNGGKDEKKADSYSLVPALNVSYTPNIPTINLIKQVPIRQERSFKPKAEIAKKPAKRFMVLNQNQESYKYNPNMQYSQTAKFYDDPSERQGTNLLDRNYSGNSSEPLKKFGI